MYFIVLSRSSKDMGNFSDFYLVGKVGGGWINPHRDRLITNGPFQMIQPPPPYPPTRSKIEYKCFITKGIITVSTFNSSSTLLPPYLLIPLISLTFNTHPFYPILIPNTPYVKFSFFFFLYVGGPRGSQKSKNVFNEI